ncbi:MAG: endonuclease/exonuclease/phosphatase family protein [Planctomycetota bacterium]
MIQLFVCPRAIARVLLVALLALCASVATIAQTGTFIDKLRPTDVRVVSYNLGGFNDGFSDQPFNFTNGQWQFDDNYARVVGSLDADVWAFQEIAQRSSSDIRSAMNLADPLPNGQSWRVYKFSNQVIASRYAFSDTGANVFGSPRRPTVATIDLPDEMALTDLHLVNIHLKAGGSSSDESRRITDIDRLIQYLREAQIPGGFDDLEQNTPFVVLGDYNTAAGFNPLINLRDGDIQNEGSFGSDALLDWDGTQLEIVQARHNLNGSPNWTFASGSFVSRLDWQMYSDSVMSLAQAFMLNTQSLSTAERNATGLQFSDTSYSGSFVDHIPVVADYRFRSVVIPEPGLLGLGCVLAITGLGFGRRFRTIRG